MNHNCREKFNSDLVIHIPQLVTLGVVLANAYWLLEPLFLLCNNFDQGPFLFYVVYPEGIFRKQHFSYFFQLEVKRKFCP